MFDREDYNLYQILDALTCPLNRNGTREEYGCDDEYLNDHPQLLFFHYITFGGAKEWEEKHWGCDGESNEAIANLITCFKNYSKMDTLRIVLNKKVRHIARIKHACNDDTLFYNPTWILEAYLELSADPEFYLDDVLFS